MRIKSSIFTDKSPIEGHLDDESEDDLVLSDPIKQAGEEV